LDPVNDRQKFCRGCSDEKFSFFNAILTVSELKIVSRHEFTELPGEKKYIN
jgi:hypothetical protein